MSKSSKTLDKTQIEIKREKRESKSDKPKTIKELLGELYADKIFLEKLIEDDLKHYDKKDQTKQSNKLSLN